MPLRDGFSRCVLTPDAEESQPYQADIAMAVLSPTSYSTEETTQPQP